MSGALLFGEVGAFAMGDRNERVYQALSVPPKKCFLLTLCLGLSPAQKHTFAQGSKKYQGVSTPRRGFSVSDALEQVGESTQFLSSQGRRFGGMFYTSAVQ